MAESKPLTTQQVRQVARLSRLHLSDDEIEQFTQQLGRVLDYIAKLDELDLDQVEPLAAALDLTNVWREDTESKGMLVDTVLANAPQHEAPFFKVPKVLGDGPSA